MPLIQSISGIRGTMGGVEGDGLTPADIVRWTSAFAVWARSLQKRRVVRMLVGRDGRQGGEIIEAMVARTLQMMGVEVVVAGLTATPTLAYGAKEMGVCGIMVSASHNPMEWNALKFFNKKGEFVSVTEAEAIACLVRRGGFVCAPYDGLGTVEELGEGFFKRHLEAILSYSLVDREAVAQAELRVVVDGINSVGAHYVPQLLSALGVSYTHILNADIKGVFAHNPEPLEAHLKVLQRSVRQHKAHIGIAVDPDVDRLCFVDEKGRFFGEEYTLVVLADYVASEWAMQPVPKRGAIVNNMLSSLALVSVAKKYKLPLYSAKVGETNVIELMKAKRAIVGGEGSGGIILPDFHYCRDALLGIGLALTALAKKKITASEWRASFPNLVMYKDKCALPEDGKTIAVFRKLKKAFKERFGRVEGVVLEEEDGLKWIIAEEEAWLCVRRSNTEPILRIYSEARSADLAYAWGEWAKEVIAGK